MILKGWKEIAKYLGCGVRTVQRWEKSGLPVHRPSRQPLSAVCAFTEQLDRWLQRETEVSSAEHTLLSSSHVSRAACTAQFSRRILVVDDDEPVLVATAGVLCDEGYEVRTAKDGFAALGALRGGMPDILISDLIMPRMSGYELLAVVRKRFPAIGVIARSADFPTTLDSVAADRFLGKSEGATSELVRTVRELLLVCPPRSQPARENSSPASVPRSSTGYATLSCPMCLRTTSVPTRDSSLEIVLKHVCCHCGTEVSYRCETDVQIVEAAAQKWFPSPATCLKKQTA